VDDTDETTDTMMLDEDVSDDGRNEQHIDDDHNVINTDDSNINSDDKDADISDVGDDGEDVDANNINNSNNHFVRRSTRNINNDNKDADISDVGDDGEDVDANIINDDAVLESVIRMSLINELKSDTSPTPTTSFLMPPLDYCENRKQTKDFFNVAGARIENGVIVHDATSFPLREQILPHRYKGQSILHAESWKLIKDTDGVRSKVDELVYGYPQQMPTDDSDNGWDIVIRKSTSPLPIRINTRNNRVIELEYLTGKQQLPATITTAVPYFIDNHTPVRKKEGEGGIMTAGGGRVEIRVGAVTDYRPRLRINNTSNEEISKMNLRESCIDFHRLLLKSFLKKKYMDVLDQLLITGNIRKVTDDEQSYNLLPSYAFSWNLTNPIHLDGNDFTRSNALFYPSIECPGGRTWLLFPEYKLAIECASPVLISWDGRVEKHCSCTNNNIGAGDIYSYFAASWKNVQRHINIERAFLLENHSEILIGDLVYVRCEKKDLESKGLQMYDCGTNDSYCTYLKANVRTIIRSNNKTTQVLVVFIASARRLGPLKFDMNDIRNVKDVKKVEDT